MPRIISVDDHVVEPPEPVVEPAAGQVPQRRPPHRVPAPGRSGARRRHLPGAPRCTEGRNVAWWLYEDHTYSIKRLIAAAGYPYDEVSVEGITYDEMRPGCWQPKARVADMEMNHTDASLCFPNYPRFCGQLFNERQDKELSLLCVKAYNDWMVEEWCGDSGGRLIPLCLVPLWDAELAAAEIYRNAERGVRAVAFSELPTWLGLPSIHSGYWDPFFAACAETGTVVCMHIGSGTRTVSHRRRRPRRGNRLADLLQQCGLDWSTSSTPECCTAIPTSSSCTPKPRSGGSPTPWSGPTTCG